MTSLPDTTHTATTEPPSAEMRQVIVTSEHGARVRRAPVPVPAPGEALVRMTAVGICGSDTHALHGRHPFIPLPYAPGHEVLGVVEEVADGVRRVSAGQRVIVEPTLPCWACKQCLAGRVNLCENLRFFGCIYDQGGMADYFTIPADRLHVVPDQLEDRQAILVEPLSTPVHAARLAGPLDGKAVVIIGAGTIGLLLLAIVLRHGARRVVVTDMLQDKRRRALRLGAHAVIDAGGPDVSGAVREALGESADVVFDCVANQYTVDQSVSLALKGGTVVIVGVPTGRVSVPLPEIQDMQVRIQGSATYLPEDYAEAMATLLAGQVRPDDIITATFPLDRVGDAFAAATSGQHIKVILTSERMITTRA
ncbi:zinc-dependent alcohol dehydrogenase [Jatrophihabitans sp.]|jgi:2-desacetyl-2-hydroxyethyl bacteriochlorophyllide A dehydrogenase|uniref:zinc-dependent alcohol dehydrogenase n=1 Tax=Jatrophihabitans sp. TaxID=1932789 RepID=UPI002EF8731D